MEKETSKNKIYFLIGVIITLLFVIIVNFITSKASYRKTESIPLAKGTINYSLADLNIIAIYQEKDEYTDETDKYESINIMPSEGYAIDEEKSYCYITNKEEHDQNAKLYTNNKGEHVIANITKGSKCYLYFEKVRTPSSKTLAKLGELIPTLAPELYTAVDIEDHGNIIYYTEDNDGVSYFYRGAAKNNWVKFGTNDAGDKDVWWRIIRINGDGTIRLIYTGMYDKGINPEPGENAFVTGPNTVVAANQYYSMNGTYNDNTYVGYYYGSTGGEYPTNHSNAYPSNIATQVTNWYNGVNWKAEDFEKYIDEDAGFCNDRTIHPDARTWYTSEGDNGRGAGKVVTAYGPFFRTMTTTAGWNSTKQTPTLICGKSPTGSVNEVSESDYKRDLYTLKQEKRIHTKTVTKGNGKLDVPVGLITADEVIFAGGFGPKSNQSYYLYNNQSFWTMSPCLFNGSLSHVFDVRDNGDLVFRSLDDKRDVRPVINLRADVKISGHGLSNDPYVIETE